LPSLKAIVEEAPGEGKQSQKWDAANRKAESDSPRSLAGAVVVPDQRINHYRSINTCGMMTG
jgi:hypothetical protein